MGYGGSCFPKDIKAPQKTANNVGYHARILQAVEDVNTDQKLFLFDKIMRFYNGDINDKTFAIWGLAFKPNTDDIRDAASIRLIQKLWEQGAKIQAYDPEAMPNFKKQFNGDGRYVLCDSANDALENTHALCVITEWSEFKSPEFKLLSEKLIDKVIFDGRNVLNKDQCREVGIDYFRI
jgi:UDPglucose 6-dehydrogenase